jgi:hypothetical protein
MRLLFAPIDGRGFRAQPERAPEPVSRPQPAPKTAPASGGFEPYVGRSVRDVLAGLDKTAPTEARSLAQLATICLAVLLVAVGLLLSMGYYLMKEPPDIAEATEEAPEVEPSPAQVVRRVVPPRMRTKQQRVAARLMTWKPSTPAADEVAAAGEPAEPTSRLFKAMPVSPLRGTRLSDPQLDTLDLAAPPVDDSGPKDRDAEVAQVAEIGRVPRLGGIIRTAAGPAAILDGQPVGLGERIGSYRVEQMESDRVVMSYKDKWIELALPER